VISADGRYIAFVSTSWNLLGEEPPARFEAHVYLYDRVSGKNELVSHASSSPRQPERFFSFSPSISADGRFVAFLSASTDLVAGQRDTNDTWDVFLYDRISKQNVLVSHASSSPTAATVSGSGSRRPVISADGSTVLFDSEATNLVPGQRSTAGRSNVFLFHRPTGKTSLPRVRSRRHPGQPGRRLSLGRPRLGEPQDQRGRPVRRLRGPAQLPVPSEEGYFIQSVFL
jgi:Tol biopolymer transport system component